jgi:hypothetical protein
MVETEDYLSIYKSNHHVDKFMMSLATTEMQICTTKDPYNRIKRA